MKRIAFDIDDTIWKVAKNKDGGLIQVPDYELIQVLKWFHNNGDMVFIWSAGGIEYTETICEKLGLSEFVNIIPKGEDSANINSIDITFDDMEINIGKVNVRVNREQHEY